MRIDRRRVGFGLFLVTVGVVMVAVRQGLIPDETARRAWSLWPLLLIGFGLSMILAGRPGSALGGLIVAVTFGAIVGGVAATGSIGICTGARDGGSANAPDASGDLGASGHVTIEQACGDLDLTTMDGSTWAVGVSSGDGPPPTIGATASDLRITSPSSGMLDANRGSSWRVVIPRSPSIDLDVTVSAGDARLELGGAHLAGLSLVRNAGSATIDLREVATIASLSVTVNAGSATIWLPNRSLTGHLNANAGSIALCLPTGAGLRVATQESVAASNDFGGHGLTRTGDTWETSGYANAEIRIDLTAEANAASLSLDAPSACAA
jgi:Domain of unknown function (DUF5668)